MNPDDTFIDKKKRTIGIDVNDGSVVVYSGEKRIGEFTLKVIDNDYEPPEVHADVIDVDKEFREAGIGSEMLKRAFEHHGRKIIPPPTYDPNPATRNSMTREGHRLMEAGQRHGWVADFPDRLPDPADDSSDFLDD